MKAQLREQAVRLRLDKNLGYVAIAKEVSVSKSTLSSWLRKYPLSEVRIKELRQENLKNNGAKIEAFRKTMIDKRTESFNQKYKKYQEYFSSLSSQTRFVAGLMLYLAEGSKTDPYHIALANTNPDTIKFFVAWAEEFLDIPKNKLKFELHLYSNMDIEKEVGFWQKELAISKGQFYKHQIKELEKSSFTYRESFRHGTCSVRYGSSEKKQELMAAIKAFMDSCLK